MENTKIFSGLFKKNWFWRGDEWGIRNERWNEIKYWKEVIEYVIEYDKTENIFFKIFNLEWNLLILQYKEETELDKIILTWIFGQLYYEKWEEKDFNNIGKNVTKIKVYGS